MSSTPVRREQAVIGQHAIGVCFGVTPSGGTRGGGPPTLLYDMLGLVSSTLVKRNSDHKVRTS